MIRHFERGYGAVTYHCAICKRLTRRTWNTMSEICGMCYELCGMDNHHNDNGTVPTARQMASYEKKLAKIVAKGGDGQRVQDACSFIWVRS